DVVVRNSVPHVFPVGDLVLAIEWTEDAWCISVLIGVVVLLVDDLGVNQGILISASWSVLRQCLGRFLCPAYDGRVLIVCGRSCLIRENIDAVAAIGNVLMPQVQYAGIRAAGGNVRLEALADRETSSQILMRVLGHDEVRCIFGEHASCELFGFHVVLFYCFWV